MINTKNDLQPPLPKGLRQASNPPVKSWDPPAATKATANQPKTTSNEDEMLLVCLQDPFDGIGTTTTKTHAERIPCADRVNPKATGSRKADSVTQLSHNHWRLRTTLEMSPPGFFESWATRGSFQLNLRVTASATESDGHWGGHLTVSTSPGTCRVLIMRDADNKVRLSLKSGCHHTAESSMPPPDNRRFLNADVAFEANANAGVSGAAVAVISTNRWSQLISGSAAATKGLAFNGSWRKNLESFDGDSLAQGAWSFAVMSRADYSALCRNNGWSPHIDD